MKVYILRHGQTDANKAHLLQGRSNRPLNEEGILQARQAGEWFQTNDIQFKDVYSGPLQRAIQTTEIASGITPQIDERLTEMDYGSYEDMDLRNPNPEITEFFRDFIHVPAPAGMEPLEEVTGRLGAFLADLAQNPVEGNVLISTHAIAMKGALEYLTPESQGSYWHKFIGNCAVYVTEYTEKGYSIPEEVYP